MTTRNDTSSDAADPSRHVAVVEDDTPTREAMDKWIRELGHDVSTFSSGEALLASVPLARFDVYVLDWGLPGLPGIGVLRELRTTRKIDSPVIFCTSREAETDVVEALTAGADDFIVKPIRKHELAARITAAIRRCMRAEPETGALQFGPFRIDLTAREIAKNGQRIDLQNREYELAVMLFRHLNGVVPREKIIHSLWGNVPLDGSRSLDTHISRIRRKLGLTAEIGYTLQSVYGKGYRLQAIASEMT